MKTAIIGRGLLVKEPRQLPIVGEWQPDGPKLWIEFSGISQRGARPGCLNLVIDECFKSEVTTLYVLSKRSDLPRAIADLQKREGTSQDDIGFCEVASGRFAPKALSSHPKSCERIRSWAQTKEFDAVIWTALARRFKDAIGIPFSPTAALNYLTGLPVSTKKMRSHTSTTFRSRQ